MSYLLGSDAGTSGAKALLIDPDGAAAASATEEYPLHTPHPLWAEQDPEDWWRAVVGAIGAVLERAGAEAGEVAGLGLTGQMHGMVALDPSVPSVPPVPCRVCSTFTQGGLYDVHPVVPAEEAVRQGQPEEHRGRL